MWLCATDCRQLLIASCTVITRGRQHNESLWWLKCGRTALAYPWAVTHAHRRAERRAGVCSRAHDETHLPSRKTLTGSDRCQERTPVTIPGCKGSHGISVGSERLSTALTDYIKKICWCLVETKVSKTSSNLNNEQYMRFLLSFISTTVYQLGFLTSLCCGVCCLFPALNAAIL